MKKLLAIMISLLMVVGLAACGGGTPSSSDQGGDVTLNALFMKQAGYSEDDVKAMTDAFTAETGINVNLTFVAYEELSAKILTSHPADSYQLVRDVQKQYELHIVNPDKCWSVSKYLVVLVK